ncbi:MAG: protein phosphatase 2C domain-containing protein [Aeromicrobium sp.]|uniref:PP2C family protein-serine/threonine phosphatase n=1 Tax=Aeromicrobium sp. TaxID=1871063 RepID=UPI0039E2947B
MALRLQIAARTHIGLTRTSHQDSVHLDGWTASSHDAHATLDLRGRGVVAVIDGMGGHPGGETASRVASAALADLDLASAADTTTVDAIVQRVSDTVRETGARTEGYASMGATIAGFVVREEELLLFNVGDCSILRLRDGYVGQLALIDRVERGDGRPGVVAQSLGGTPTPTAVDAHADRFTPAPDDLLIVCSDGLTDPVGHEEIAALADQHPDPETLARHLVAAACRAGGPDNISVVVVRPRLTD